jgi:hypothetical protein
MSPEFHVTLLRKNIKSPVSHCFHKGFHDHGFELAELTTNTKCATIPRRNSSRASGRAHRGTPVNLGHVGEIEPYFRSRYMLALHLRSVGYSQRYFLPLCRAAAATNTI